jgi:SagB-type dehydrogenase family enzyme
MKGAVLSQVGWLLIGLSFLPLPMMIGMGHTSGSDTTPNVKLPEPRLDGGTSVETAILLRRSVRQYARQALSLADVSQLLWAAQGITASTGFRSAPSAGALYPLEVDLVCGHVDGLEPGAYRYNPKGHSLSRRLSGDKRSGLCSAALGQSSVAEAPAVLVISAVYERTTRKYGERGIRYAHTEAGHAAQNVCLQAAALKLGTVHIGAFQDESVAKVLELRDEEKPLILLPIGKILP